MRSGSAPSPGGCRGCGAERWRRSARRKGCRSRGRPRSSPTPTAASGWRRSTTVSFSGTRGAASRVDSPSHRVCRAIASGRWRRIRGGRRGSGSEPTAGSSRSMPAPSVASASSRGASRRRSRVLFADPLAAETLWVGGASGGLHELRGGRFHARHDPRNGLGPGLVRFLGRERAGTLLAASESGLFRLEGERWREVRLGGEPVGAPRAWTEAEDGVLWVASERSGLIGSVGGGAVRLGEAEGLPFNPIFSLEFDRSGGLWLSGNDGLVRLRREDLERAGAQGDRLRPLRDALGARRPARARMQRLGPPRLRVAPRRPAGLPDGRRHRHRRPHGARARAALGQQHLRRPRLDRRARPRSRRPARARPGRAPLAHPFRRARVRPARGGRAPLPPRGQRRGVADGGAAHGSGVLLSRSGPLPVPRPGAAARHGLGRGDGLDSGRGRPDGPRVDLVQEPGAGARSCGGGDRLPLADPRSNAPTSPPSDGSGPSCAK